MRVHPPLSYSVSLLAQCRERVVLVFGGGDGGGVVAVAAVVVAVVSFCCAVWRVFHARRRERRFWGAPLKRGCWSRAGVGLMPPRLGGSLCTWYLVRRITRTYHMKKSVFFSLISQNIPGAGIFY